MSYRLALGIDPGITGAVALVGVQEDAPTPTLLDVLDVPTATHKVNGANKSHLLLPALAAMIEDLAVGTPFASAHDVFIEEVNAMPGQGVTSMFRFGYAAGAIEGVCSALGLVVHKLPPRQWQAIARTRKDPDAGRLRAGQLFPNQAKLFARKMDHNRADAALIAYVGALRLIGRA